MKLKHVAIIMDGNRRWAKKNKLKILTGHKRAGEFTIEPIVDVAIEKGIKHITFWAFSTENWNRSKLEVYGLMKIFRTVAKRIIKRAKEKGIKGQMIGDLSRFPKDIQQIIKDGIKETKNNKKITVVFALSYGGRDEILRAVDKLRISPKFQVSNSKLSEKEFEKYLDTADMPDPDLIIRTGGEKRLSGFLLWQSAYSELYFTDVLFPDFSPQEFRKALKEYASRNRRFGK